MIYERNGVFSMISRGVSTIVKTPQTPRQFFLKLFTDKKDNELQFGCKYFTRHE